MTRDRAFRHLTVMALAFGAVLFLVNAVDLVRLDGPGDYVEGVVLLAQHDSATGSPLYEPAGWQSAPYRINLYGPVFYRLGAWGLKLSGNPTSFRPGRVTSLLALGGAMLIAWRIARRELQVSRLAAGAGLLVVLGFLPVVIFAPQNRVDTVAAALSLAGLAIGLRPGRWAPAVAGLLFVIGVFTKPTAVAAPIAFLLWLAWRRRFRDAWALGLVCLASGSVWLAILSATTQGGFITSLFRFNANPYAIGGLLKALQAVFGSPVLPLVAAVALVLVLTGSEPERLLAGYFLVALLVAVATVGKIGANINYFLEPGLAMAPLAALSWDRFRNEVTSAPVFLSVVAVGLLFTAPRVASEWSGRRQRLAVERSLVPLLSGKRVLTMEVGTALRAGAQPVLNDPHIFARLAEAKLWDESFLVAELGQGRIDIVLADSDLGERAPVFSNFSPAVRSTVSEHYRLERRLGPNLWLYRPREAGP